MPEELRRPKIQSMRDSIVNLGVAPCFFNLSSRVAKRFGFPTPPVCCGFAVTRIYR